MKALDLRAKFNTCNTSLIPIIQGFDTCIIRIIPRKNSPAAPCIIHFYTGLLYHTARVTLWLCIILVQFWSIPCTTNFTDSGLNSKITMSTWLRWTSTQLFTLTEHDYWIDQNGTVKLWVRLTKIGNCDCQNQDDSWPPKILDTATNCNVDSCLCVNVFVFYHGTTATVRLSS